MGGCGAGTKDKGEEEGIVWSLTRVGGKWWRDEVWSSGNGRGIGRMEKCNKRGEGRGSWGVSVSLWCVV